MSPEWIIGTLVTILLVAVPGTYRWWRTAMKTAYDEALATARLEAVGREAEKALEAKNAEVLLLRDQVTYLQEALVDCAREVRG